MNTQHTPGPWKTAGWLPDTIECQQMIVTDSPSPMVIATVFHDISTGEANARLIAAAPELLEALQTTQDAIQAVLSLPAHEPASVVLLIRQLMEAKGKANEAIAKATQP